MPSNLVSPIPAALQAPTAVVMTRGDVARISPQVDQLLRLALAGRREWAESDMPCAGCIVGNSCVSAALDEFFAFNDVAQEHVIPHTILIQIPELYQDSLVAMAAQKPSLQNWWTTCLQFMHTYLSWSTSQTSATVTDDRHPSTQLWVLERDVRDSMQKAMNMIFCAEGSLRWCWQPVIFVCDERVAVGGFAIDASFADTLQVTTFVAANFSPIGLFRDDELEQAAVDALLVGNTPWFETFCQTEEAYVLGTRVLYIEATVTDGQEI